MELFALDQHWSWAERMALYFEAYQRTQRMPEPYAGDTFWNLIRSPVADGFVRQSLGLIEQAPEGPNPARLLYRLAMHPEVAKNRAWRSQVEAVLARIEANPSGRFDEVLVTTARRGREHLRRTPPH